MFKRLQQFVDRNPFLTVMSVAFVVRVFSVIFLHGYGANMERQDHGIALSFLGNMHDSLSRSMPSAALEATSRCFFALVSMMTVAIFYRIIDLISNKKTACVAGVIAAISCAMPSFGVMYGVSAFVGLPLLLYGVLVVLRQEVLRKARHDNELHRTSYIVAGFSLGLGVCVWRQSAFLVLGIIIVLLSKRHRKEAFLTTIGCVVAIALIVVLLLMFSSNPQQYLFLK